MDKANTLFKIPFVISPEDFCNPNLDELSGWDSYPDDVLTQNEYNTILLENIIYRYMVFNFNEYSI